MRSEVLGVPRALVGTCYCLCLILAILIFCCGIAVLGFLECRKKDSFYRGDTGWGDSHWGGQVLPRASSSSLLLGTSPGCCVWAVEVQGATCCGVHLGIPLGFFCCECALCPRLPAASVKHSPPQRGGCGPCWGQAPRMGICGWAGRESLCRAQVPPTHPVLRPGPGGSCLGSLAPKPGFVPVLASFGTQASPGRGGRPRPGAPSLVGAEEEGLALPSWLPGQKPHS